MAFRIIVPTRRRVLHARWAPSTAAYPVIAGRFKDYISTPKPNGYQSLHTGVTLRPAQPEDRGADPHPRDARGRRARRRRALDYKQDAAEPTEGKQFRWVQDLLEILEHSSAPDEFLENTKLELYQDQVFCFTPKGELIQLPRGATPVDFAYAVHSPGRRHLRRRQDQRPADAAAHELQNGDQVEIITSKGGTPSPTWERFVVTGKARARIRRFIRSSSAKGVTVHVQDCAQLEAFAATPERFIDVDWDYTHLARPKDKPSSGNFTGRISVIASNIPASLANIANAVAKQEGAISNLKVVQRQQDFFEALVDVEIRDLRHLNQVVAGLRGAAGIAQVERQRS
jgi:(p)ppGpp synthase/HD superfamily hydrolase